MSIASRIQEIETHIGDVYDTINYSYDTTGVNKNIINIPKYLKKGYIDIINNGIDTLYNNFPKVSEIGSNLSLTPTYEAPIKLNEIQGDTLQNGTPTPSSPVPIQSVTGLQNVTISNSDNTDSNTYEVNLGKNLFVGKENYSQTINGVVFNIKESQLTINGTSTSTSQTNINSGNFIIPYKVEPNTQYTYSVKVLSGNVSGTRFAMNLRASATTSGTDIQFNTGNSLELINGDNSSTFISKANANYLTGLQFIYSADINFDNLVLGIQLEKGSTATSYSPYFTPIELNKIGDYEDSIKKSTGKNLFDKDNANIFNGYLNGNEGIVSNNNNRITYIQIENDKTYTISKVLSNRFRIGLTNSVPSNNLQINDYSSQDNQTSYTFTNTSYKYLCIWFWTNTDTLTEQRILDSIMIEENNQATSYEPYGKVWYVTKNEIKYNVDTTQLTLKSNYTNIEYAEIPKPSNYAGYNSYDHTEIKYTNANWIEMSAGGWDLSNNIGKISGNADKLKWWVGFAKGTGLDVIKTALTGSYIVYPLSTPIYEVITNTELIEQLESLYNAKSKDGTTNINVTSEDLSMILNVGVLKGDA